MAKYNAQIASLLVDIVINTRRYQSQLTNIQNQTNNAAQQMRRNLTQIGLAASAFLIVNKAAGLVVNSINSIVDASLKLEKQLVAIQAIAKFESFDVLQEKFFQLADTLKGVSFEEISNAAQDAARLGIRGGPDEFLSFVEAASKLAKASGDLTFSEASEGLGKLLLNFNLSEKNALKLASTIDRLNDAFPITSGQIVNSSTKLSGLANTIGLTVQELTALVTSLRATGTTSTVVESSLTRLFVLFQENAAGVADALGLSGDAFNKFLYNVRNAPMEAIKTFFEVLSKKSAQEAVAVLSELELTTAKNAAGYLNLAKNVDNLHTALQTTNEEWEKASNLNEKFNKITETGAAKLVDLEKSWTSFKANLIENESIKETIDWLDKLITGYGVAFSAKNKLFNISGGGEKNTVGSIESQLKELRNANSKIMDNIQSGIFAQFERSWKNVPILGALPSRVSGGLATMLSGSELGQIEENTKKINALTAELQELLLKDVREKEKQEELEKARTKKLEEIQALEAQNAARLRNIVAPGLVGEFSKNLPGEKLTMSKAQKFALDMEQYFKDFIDKHKAVLKEVPEAELQIRAEFNERLRQGLQQIANDEIRGFARFLDDLSTSFDNLKFEEVEESPLQSKISNIFNKLDRAKQDLHDAEAKIGGVSNPLRDKFEILGRQAVAAAEKLKLLAEQEALGDLAKARLDLSLEGRKTKIPDLINRAQKLDEIFNRLKDAEKPLMGPDRANLIKEFLAVQPELPKLEFGDLDSIWQKTVERANEEDSKLPPEVRKFLENALPFFVKNEDLQKELGKKIEELENVGAVQ